MSVVTIDGKVYNIVERMGFNHSIGMHAMIVQDGDSERSVVKASGIWRFWIADDKIKTAGRYVGQ